MPAAAAAAAAVTLYGPRGHRQQRPIYTNVLGQSVPCATRGHNTRALEYCTPIISTHRQAGALLSDAARQRAWFPADMPPWPP